ncbi:hypothetical protein LPJ66_011636, partial [Kickxella alabastrina]
PETVALCWVLQGHPVVGSDGRLAAGCQERVVLEPAYWKLGAGGHLSAANVLRGVYAEGPLGAPAGLWKGGGRGGPWDSGCEGYEAAGVGV